MRAGTSTRATRGRPALSRRAGRRLANLSTAPHERKGAANRLTLQLTRYYELCIVELALVVALFSRLFLLRLDPLLLLDDLDVEREAQQRRNTRQLVQFCMAGGHSRVSSRRPSQREAPGRATARKAVAASLVEVARERRRDARWPDSCIDENMSTSPPYALTSSTSLTNMRRRATDGALHKQAPSASSSAPETRLGAAENEEDAPEELVRDEELADGASLGRSQHVPLAVPRSQRVLVEHLEKSAHEVHKRVRCEVDAARES